MSDTSIPVAPARKQSTPLSYLLIFVFALFIGILVVAYIITRQTEPIQLDEHGKQVNSQPFAHPNSRGCIEKV